MRSRYHLVETKKKKKKKSVHGMEWKIKYSLFVLLPLVRRNYCILSLYFCKWLFIKNLTLEIMQVWFIFQNKLAT